jgi:myo-inositol-1(or 4)-monophosphatase
MIQPNRKFIKKIIKKAGIETLKYYGKAKVQYTKKHENDIVTQADLASNKILLKEIKKYFPKHNIITEETTPQNNNSEYTWIIDPLDGTGNFKRKIPNYGVIIALVKNREVIIGSFYSPVTNELYYAEKNKGAFLNGKRIQCTETTNLKNSRGTGYFIIEGKRKNQIRKFSESSETYNLWITEYGSGAYDMMLVASGRAEWYFAPNLGGGIWDIAGPYLILKEAGCKTTNFNGEEWSIKDVTEIIAANPILHKEIMKIIKE